MWNPTLEQLAQELKSLIGYGASRKHVLARPTLRQLTLAKYGNLNGPQLADAIVYELRHATSTFPPRKAEAWRYLLNLDELDLSAIDRRQSAIVLLNIGYNVDTFRRPESPEMRLCRELAPVLYEQLSLQPA